MVSDGRGSVGGCWWVRISSIGLFHFERICCYLLLSPTPVSCLGVASRITVRLIQLKYSSTLKKAQSLFESTQLIIISQLCCAMTISYYLFHHSRKRRGRDFSSKLSLIQFYHQQQMRGWIILAFVFPHVVQGS
jgi:hypothetical protein